MVEGVGEGRAVEVERCLVAGKGGEGVEEAVGEAGKGGGGEEVGVTGEAVEGGGAGVELEDEEGDLTGPRAEGMVRFPTVAREASSLEGMRNSTRGQTWRGSW